MDSSGDAFLQRLRATFRVEAEDHVRAMSAGLLGLEKRTDVERAPLLEAIFRHAHSLKGAARATNFSAIESICQALETVFARWKRNDLELSAAHFDTLHRSLDLIGRIQLTASGRPAPTDEASFSTVLRELAKIAASGAPPSTSCAEESTPPSATLGDAPEPVSLLPESAPAPAPSPANRTAGNTALVETIRVPTDRLDRLLLEVEELLTVKQTATQHASELGELAPVLREWAKRWTKVQPHVRELRQAGSSELTEFLDLHFAQLRFLEGRVHSLARTALQEARDTSRLIDDLLAESKALVMLPFSTLADLLPKLVRDLSRDQGKEVELVMRGGEIEMDKRILEEIKDPLVHLLRNSVDHGIESPAQRSAQGKSSRASIEVTITPVEGNKVEIAVTDDGAGIDVARVKQTAVKRGLLSPQDATSLDERQILDLIFLSDVSTSPIITEISGRGLGLAIVREKAEKLGGRATVETRPGAGTTFRLLLPLTLATFRGVLVRTAGQIFVLPAHHVERAMRIRFSEVKTVGNRETVTIENRAVALARLDDLLEFPRRASETGSPDFVSLVVIGSGDERVAFAVDEVLHVEEVLVKTFGRPLSRVRNVAAATILASTKVALILNVADLLKSVRKSPARSRPSPAAAAQNPGRVLVAEDSITSRQLLKGILETAGYRVKTAVDGVDALTLLRTEEFDVVVSDVEMPRMNGFELTTRIRADKQLADLPVVLVTALASAADRERGADAGANAYLVKSDFDQSNLLGVLRRLV